VACDDADVDIDSKSFARRLQQEDKKHSRRVETAVALPTNETYASRPSSRRRLPEVFALADGWIAERWQKIGH
jgi:hypothetical protein